MLDNADAVIDALRSLSGLRPHQRGLMIRSNIPFLLRFAKLGDEFFE
jgi:hypothetical protein